MGPFAIILSALLLVTTGLWRFVPGWWVLPVSGLAVLVALVAGARRQREEWLPWLGLGALLVTALFALDALKASPGWIWCSQMWPCETACQGGKFYQTLFKTSLTNSDSGIPTWVCGGGAYLILMILGFLGRGRPRLGVLAQLVLWGCLGGSVYYLILSGILGMLCGHCLAVHTIVLCGLAAGLRADLDWRFRLGTAVIAALALHAAYHPTGLTEVVMPPPASPVVETAPAASPGVTNFANIGRTPTADTTLSSADLDYLCQVDRGRRIGAAAAPYQVEFVVNLTCPHCEASHDAMQAAWSNLIDRGRVQIVFRHAFRWNEEKDRRLACFALAAAAVGDYRVALFAILGVDDRLNVEDRLEAIAMRGLPVAPLKTEEMKRRLLLERLLRADSDHLTKLRGTPPLIRITGPAWPQGRTWKGKEIDFAAIAATIGE